jgi:hypothetical protein
MAGEQRAKTVRRVSGGPVQPRLRKALTRPEAEEVLRVARLNGAHGAVLDAHNRSLGVERHREKRRTVGGRW